MQFARRLTIALALVLPTVGCRGSGPRWSPDQAVLPYAEFHGDTVDLYNIRNCEYRTTTDYVVRHYDKTFDLNQVASVDFIMVPFSDMPAGAHTFLTFGFDTGDHIAISIEVRRRDGEEFDVVKGMTGGFELMYVIADERDVIQLRTNYRMDDVYLYHGVADREHTRALLVDMLERANKLRKEPEAYHLLTNNCTTNVMAHVNRIAPNKVPYTYQVLLPGYSDRLAYDLGLIKSDDTFERTRELARINKVAYVYRDSPDFSTLIRR
jgi:hypothetical protein